MGDLELLKFAAMAVGLPLCEEWDCAADGCGILIGHGNGDLRPWNPLADDADALRLAVELNLQVTPGTYRSDEATAFRAGVSEAHEYVHYQQDLFASTRRAIVRAAAEIGKQ